MRVLRKYLSHIVYAALGAIVLWWGLSLEGGSYHWQWHRALRYVFRWTAEGFVAGPLLQGLALTMRIVCAAFVVALCLGLGSALVRRGPSVLGRSIAAAYVGLVRNTPLLIQLFIMYFVLAPLLDVRPFWAAVWALALFEGAYMAEIFRAGLGAVPQSQWDAAYSLGLPRHKVFMLVVLPQALRRIVPPLTNQSVSLIKDSALVSAIALPDLTMQAQLVIAETFLSLELWVFVAALYLCMTLCISGIAALLERRYAWQWI